MATPAQPPPAAPATAPSAEPPAAGPTLTLGAGGATVGNASAPTKDAPSPGSAPATEEKKPPTTPIDGSTFFFQTGVSPNLFSPGMVQSPDVSVDSFALLQPRWALNKDWQVRGRLPFSYEFTDNITSSTTRKNEPRFLDLALSLAYRGIPAFGGVKAVAVAIVGLPTSPESQARTLYFSPGVSVALARLIEHVLGGELALALSVSYSHPIYQFKTAGLENPLAYGRACFSAGDTSCGNQASGGANTANSVTALASVSGEWGKWSPSVFMLLINGWAYTFKDLSGVARIDSPTSFRQSTYFGAALDYQITPWLAGEVGYQMLRNVLDGDGKFGNPFYSAYQDSMRVYLGTNVLLDKLYLAATGRAEPARPTKAQKTPMFISF